MDEGTITTKAGLARAIRRSPARVSQFISEGKLTPPALLSDGRIDLALALSQLAPFIGERSTEDAARVATPPPSPMAVAKLRVAEAAAAKAEHDLEVARGTQAREMTAICVTIARRLAEITIGLLEERRDKLVTKVRLAPTQRDAVAFAKDADLEMRRGMRVAIEKEGIKLGVFTSSDDFEAGLREAEKLLSE